MCSKTVLKKLRRLSDPYMAETHSIHKRCRAKEKERKTGVYGAVITAGGAGYPCEVML
jgi:hypothetical protein